MSPTSKAIFHISQLKTAVDRAEELATILAELAHDNPNNQTLLEAQKQARTLSAAIKEQLRKAEQAIQNSLNS
jgi:F0F1-type ATP synthase delta subunit